MTTASTFWRSSDEERDVGSDTGILLSNVDALNDEKRLVSRRISAQIAELATIVSASDRTHLRDTASDFSERYASDGHPDHGSHELILFCLALLRRSRLSDRDREDLFGAPPQISAKASERVAYLQNHFTDEAFSRLTSRLSKPSATYFSSFSDAAEEVYHGLCEYCILPVENPTDGRLARFYELIEKYDLRIVAVSRVETADDGFTTYALLRHKALELPRENNGDCFAEFAMVPGGRFSLSDILSAAELCRMRPARVSSLPFAYGSGYRYNVVFALPPVSEEVLRDLEAFSLYLSTVLSEYDPIGVYPQIY